LTALASDGELSGETSIYVSINITTGIVTVMQNMSVSIYPNPAVSEATIEIPEMEDEATISVYNTNGALVMQQVVTSQVSKIKVGDLNQGIYLVSIQSANKMSQKRLVIE
jgi:hypothetical protein